MLPLAIIPLGLAWLSTALARVADYHHRDTSSIYAPASTALSPSSATSTGTSPSSASAITALSTTPSASSGVAGALAVASATSTTTYSYFKPPLPTNWVVNNPANLKPNATWDVHASPTTREYWFDIGYAAGAPDGYPRRMTVVNNQFPGPLIEANSGDRVIVHVTNHAHHGQALHWHGIHQNGTQYMDGVPGVSQCLIRPNTTFTYDFQINDQWGTYWRASQQPLAVDSIAHVRWHAHESNTLADGLIGGFIVHSPIEPVYEFIDYDEDRIIFLQDWMHDESQVVVDALLEDGNYYGSGAAPEGDASLINGIGEGNCTAVHVPANCSTAHHANIDVPPNKKIRFRIINSGSHHTFRLSIDNHAFDVVEADGASIKGAYQIHEVPVAPGERYSLIVDTDQGSDDCIAAGFIEDALARFRYVSPGSEPSTSDPETQPWPDLKDPLNEPCKDLDEYYTINSVNLTIQPPTDIIMSAQMNSNFGTFVNTTGGLFTGFAFNNVSWKNTINQPLLLDVEQGRRLNPAYVPSAIFEQLGGGDIILNNIGVVAHPFHLHGRKFFIVARGSGSNITEADVANMQLNLTSPLTRDSLLVGIDSFAVLRIVSDTPGVWPLHCHIGWHLSTGKLAAIVIQPDVVAQLPQPADWEQLCAGTNPDAFGPDRRRA